MRRDGDATVSVAKEVRRTRQQWGDGQITFRFERMPETLEGIFCPVLSSPRAGQTDLVLSDRDHISKAPE